MKALLGLGLVLSLAVACGPSSQEEGGPGDGTGDNGDGDNGTGDNGDNGDQPVTCDNAAACAGGQVCDPASSTCTDGLDCATAAECGNGALCGGDGTCVKNTTGGVCDGNANCLTGETCAGGYCGCDGVAFVATPVRPNMLIVLDRSASMTNSGGTGGSKWTIAGTAINNLLDDYGVRARFGLNMFAADDWCAAGTTYVAPADGTDSNIRTTIQPSDANSNTPITATMNALVGYAGLADATRPNYILMITDGEETCDDFSSQAVTDLAAQTPPVKTFVVGFGSGVDPDQLNEMAEEGGTALPGTTK